MYGEITKYRVDLGVGVIEAENGRKYRFSKSQIVSSVRRLVGEGVDFIVDARRPCQIVMLSASPWTLADGICNRAANDH